MASSDSNTLAARGRGSEILRNATILMGLASLSLSASAHASRDPANKGRPVITNNQAWKLYEKYVSAWNTTSTERRLKIAAEVLSEDIEYQTVRHDLTIGRALVIEDMATFHERFPGGHFEIGDVSSHHNVALLTWVIIQADGKEFARGHDQITVDRDGKISKIITFGPSAKDPN